MIRSGNFNKDSQAQVEYSALSDIGLVRDVNQDAFGAREEEWGYLFIVADGFGDRTGGKVVSEGVVNRLLKEFSDKTPENLQFFVRDSLLDINSDTFTLKEEQFDSKMMGSTCACVQIQGNTAFIANVGDSRVYLIRDKKMVQLSKDQSLVQDMVDKGMITPDEALEHPGKNILTEAIGSHDTVNVHCCESPVQIMINDRILLCTDGLWGLVHNHRIRDIVMKNSPQDSVVELIDEANRNGGHDNVTAQVIHVVESARF